MEVIDRGLIYRSEQGTDSQSCAFAGVCVLPGGRWLCGFRAAPTKGGLADQHALVTWSDDEGRSWSPPSRPFEAPPVDGRPGRFRAAYPTPLGNSSALAALCWVDHSDPDLAFFNEETEGLLDTRIFLARSEDGGETWAAPRLVDTFPFTVPTPLTGPVLALPDGTLACHFELNKPYLDTAGWRHASVLLLSRDGGETWPVYACAARDPERRMFYWDQRPGALADGTLLDLFWTYDDAAAVYRNIHACESRDGGRTWSPLWDTGVPGQPAQPVSLPGGKVAMVTMDRTGIPEVKARVSVDGGRTWPAETETSLYRAGGDVQTWEKRSMEDAWAEMAAFSVGLPATARLPGGDVLVVYYAGPTTDHTGIEWARLRT